jgi:acyl-CoA reductase-like NAD-dependent aldehyde dehydrogenase
MRVAQEEIFGPTTALIPVRDVDEAIRVSNGSSTACRPRSSRAT